MCISDDAGGSEELDDMYPVQLQIGADESDIFTVELFDMRIHKLGIDQVKVTEMESAQKAIETLDVAIMKVSNVRANLGAKENALEHIHTNVINSGENATASESRISDADMALEMTEFTKRNILIQSGQAMLAQSNQLPQGILQLLN
ncbi:flagellin [Domibacillus sp. PGB-M46]|uniref:flagellin n=1 Tax=Domibacillus sp. PGB-M46 TaxID=2910255 RepID=UPI00272CAE15|nr:flagellin [Domibacillus sp. PGB-M46]